MEETFVNDFVVRVESGHPGYVSYQIIATPDSLLALSQELKDEAEKYKRAQPSTISPIEHRDKHTPYRGEALLLSKYATQDKGKSSRVSIAFMAADDLSRYHVQPKSSWNNLLLLFVLGVVCLAGIGLSNILFGP